ncbi:hypothetical protein SCHPADRAFT_948098 [Schizopora paradoxa]|uniref:Uncharacterized protein n=1 Tax=Schizopora paradoxa TaxID=27342 RepID=A0A0H2QXD1_9AGAM|nr:hypothetical protein SCHPADRAFT_948098 [Schizopora paradoxa]
MSPQFSKLLVSPPSLSFPPQRPLNVLLVIFATTTLCISVRRFTLSVPMARVRAPGTKLKLSLVSDLCIFLIF